MYIIKIIGIYSAGMPKYGGNAKIVFFQTFFKGSNLPKKGILLRKKY